MTRQGRIGCEDYVPVDDAARWKGIKSL